MSVNETIRSELSEDTVVFDNAAYDNSIIGVSSDDSAVYDYDSMVYEQMRDYQCSYEDDVEWIDFNVIRSIPYSPNPKPIIMHALDLGMSYGTDNKYISKRENNMDSRIVCNMCGVYFGIFDKKEDFTIEKKLGYGTIYDGDNLHMHLCCKCMEKIINECKVSPVTNI